jgi:hypothetical protein
VITWSADRKPPSELANAIAKDLFDMGELGGLRPHRIAFKVGDYPRKERDAGGLCEEALAQRIDASLQEHLTKEPNP